MMPALNALASARLQGAKPTEVFVLLGDYKQEAWWESDLMSVEIAIPDDVPVTRIDFRPLVGCDVIVIRSCQDDRLDRVVDRICSVALRVTVYSSLDPGDLGYVWERGRGSRKFNEQWAA